MTIEEFCGDRGIREVVHFTSSHGCPGTLYTNQLQSRARLGDDPMVEYLFKPNASLRKDPQFLDYVSLSISHINTQFFKTSANSWHREDPIFWCVLSFDPSIMAHPGVRFATTNNIYTSVRRGDGLEGLAALYEPTTIRWRGNVVSRPANLPAYHPTCSQAEVLYPYAVSTEYLRSIYVQNLADQSEVIGFLKATFHRDVPVLVAPQKFGDRAI